MGIITLLRNKFNISLTKVLISARLFILTDGTSNFYKNFTERS